MLRCGWPTRNLVANGAQRVSLDCSGEFWYLSWRRKMSRDNAGMRILSPRRALRGDESLVGTLGNTLLDGAACFVLEAQCNYRFLKHSVLHADGAYVVAPVDGVGRWVREQGLVGFASLQCGKPTGGLLIFAGYTSQQLVQFAASPDGRIMYTGTVPRGAMIMGSPVVPERALAVVIEPGQGGAPLVTHGTPEGVNVGTILVPGDRVSLVAAAAPTTEMVASLYISLQ